MLNLFELFVKIGVDDQASKKIDEISQKIGNGLKKAASVGITAIASLGTVAIKTFADFEQLAGGAELMFGDAFETVMENAKNAYKTVQMSQNEYLQQVNGFATGLKTALGGNEKAAADLAHRIVQAEADIVAATGNTAENVQNAFNGIMKSNFTMLDNLQIGITPTKEGFQEVIDKVNEWNEANGRATEYQMGNLADMQSALVDYIDMVGMSGYAQEEASGTILGSFASMKAAASDFATALIDENGDINGSFEKLKDTAFTFFDNLKPRIMAFLEAISPIATTVAGITGAFVSFKAAASISTLLSTLIASWNAYKVANEGATIAQWLMNAAMSANPIVLIVTLIGGLVAAIVTLWNTNEGFRDAISKIWDGIKNVFSGAWDFITGIFGAVGDFFSGVWDGIKNVFSNVGGWFKEKFTQAKENSEQAWANAKAIFGKIWDGVKGVFSSVGGWFKDRFTEGLENSKNAWATAKTVFSNVWTKTKEAFADVGGWFKNKFEEGKNSAASAWSNAKSVFGGIWDNIKNIFSKGADIGKNIIDGIKQGISNAWNNLVDWFKGLFGDLIGIAKKILGIASPSKVFKKLGSFTAEGFGIGFDDEFAHVKDDMEDALNFNDASVGINASIRKASVGEDGIAYGGGNISIVQNIYSKAQTAADLMQEARYQSERAVFLSV